MAIQSDKSPPALSNDSDEGVLLPAQHRLDTLLDSIACQCNELVAMKKALLEGQAQIQEERDLFQAQYYALRNQQEEREAKRVDDKQAEWKADLEYLRAEVVLDKTANSSAQQQELDSVKRHLDKESGTRVNDRDHLQDVIAGLRSAQEAQAGELAHGLEQLQARVIEIVAQISELGNAAATLKLMHDEQRQLSNTDRHNSQAQIDGLEAAVDAILTESQASQRPSIPTGPAAEHQRQSRRSSNQQAPESRRDSQAQASLPRKPHGYSRAEHKANRDRGAGQYNCEWCFHALKKYQ